MRILTLTSLGLAGTLVLAGCVQTAPAYNPDSPYQRTQQGALIGALGGAALGALTADDNDDEGDRALAGAAIGALAGGVYGNYLDRQAAELQRDITTGGVRIINEGSQLRVILPEGILFPVDSATVNPAILNDLYTVADSLNRYPGSRVNIVGHTDNTGSVAYNLDLSERRAQAVASILRGAGVPGGRLRPFGMGMDQPIASNATVSGRAQNRRVEIIIIPNG